MKTLGSIVKYRKGKPPKVGSNGCLPVLSPNYLRTGQVEEMAEPTSKDVVLKGGEIVLLWDGSNAGEFFRARAGVLSSTMVAFEFDQKETDPDYLYYDLKRFEQELKGRTSGSGIPHVDKELLLAREIFEGGPDEQKAAAKVLLQVDRAIEQTEALLAKQQRIKMGLMHDLLTRGIDKQARLRDPSTHSFKPSIFGMIPSEWDVVETSCVVEVIDPQPDHRTPPTHPNGCPYIGIGDITVSGDINVEAARKVLPSALEAQCEAFSIHPGAFIFGKIGTLGMPTRIPCDRSFAISANVVLFTSPAIEDIEYIFWVYSSALVASQLADASNTTSQPALGIKSLRAMQIPWPDSVEERASISKAIEAAHHTKSKTELMLAKLRRFKKGMMHDLLTGQVSVKPLLSIFTS